MTTAYQIIKRESENGGSNILTKNAKALFCICQSYYTQHLQCQGLIDAERILQSIFREGEVASGSLSIFDRLLIKTLCDKYKHDNDIEKGNPFYYKLWKDEKFLKTQLDLVNVSEDTKERISLYLRFRESRLLETDLKIQQYKNKIEILKENQSPVFKTEEDCFESILTDECKQKLVNYVTQNNEIGQINFLFKTIDIIWSLTIGNPSKHSHTGKGSKEKFFAIKFVENRKQLQEHIEKLKKKYPSSIVDDFYRSYKQIQEIREYLGLPEMKID